MNQTETLKILAVLRGAYPMFYKDMKRAEADSVIALWNEMFADEPYPLVATAVKALISSDSKGYPPHIGAVKEKIRELTAPKGLSAQESWNLVSNALRNGIYGAEQEFAALPPEVQAVVGSASQLHDWAMMETETVQSVVASNFQRSFRIIQKRNEDLQKLPTDVRLFIQKAAETIFRPLPPAEGDVAK